LTTVHDKNIAQGLNQLQVYHNILYGNYDKYIQVIDEESHLRTCNSFVNGRLHNQPGFSVIRKFLAENKNGFRAGERAFGFWNGCGQAAINYFSPTFSDIMLYMPKIVTIGGGTGAPIIIQSLLQAGASNLSCICASMDSGGKTGIIRSDERDHVIAISDLLRNLLALITSNNHQKNISAFTDLVSFIDGRQRNLGYTVYYALLEKYNNDFLKAQDHLENLLGIKFDGTAIPVTADSSNICFKTKNGQVFHGEHELDKQSMSKNLISKVWLNPKVAATPQAISAIQNADYIFYCPGSLYGSIISNFLPVGIKRALRESEATKILITNIVSNRNQTHKITLKKYLKIFQKYTGLKKPFDIVISPNISQKRFEKKYPKTAKSYNREHAHFIGWSKTDIKKFLLRHCEARSAVAISHHQVSKKHIKVLATDIFSITPKLNRLRHDPDKLSKIIRRIIK